MVGKAKQRNIPKKNKGKGKRWKKGHSSTSNPESKRYREAAKNRFFSKNEGNHFTCNLSRTAYLNLIKIWHLILLIS